MTTDGGEQLMAIAFPKDQISASIIVLGIATRKNPGVGTPSPDAGFSVHPRHEPIPVRTKSEIMNVIRQT